MTDLTGQYLGRYYLSERLGEGGMAVVYKAYDTRLERDVAIKIIRTGAFPIDSIAELLKRFEREAKSLAKLSHPNIVKVHDYGEHEGSPYLVMEYLPGGTLKKLLTAPIPWQTAVRLLLPIARSVAYAHQRGILHRDIKPANILITDSGEPMLSDFGIAKLFEGDQATALTHSGMAIGTPEYMAPEQWTGTTSPQSDLYSLGIVLYEMVAGRKPYMADTPAAILIKQATEPLPSPRRFTVNLPEAFEQVVVKALAREPEARYQSLPAFITALESLGLSTPLASPGAVEERAEAAPTSLSRPATSPIDRPLLVGDGATLPAVEATNLVLSEATIHETTGQEQLLSEQEKREAAERLKREQAERQARHREQWARARDNGFAIIKSTRFLLGLGAVGVLVLLFAAFKSASNNPGLARAPLAFAGVSGNEVNVYLYDVEKQTIAPVNLGGGKNWSPVINPLGNLYFTSRRQAGKAEIYRLVDGEVNRVTTTPGQFESWGPVFSPTGSMYFTSNREASKAEIFRLVDGRIERVTTTPGQFESWGPAFSPTGSMYFTSNREAGRAEIYRLVKGQIDRLTNTPGAFESWSPVFWNGNIFFSSNRSGDNRFYQLSSEAQIVSGIEALPDFLKTRAPPY